jgi:hypothetical protein
VYLYEKYLKHNTAAISSKIIAVRFMLFLYGKTLEKREVTARAN